MIVAFCLYKYFPFGGLQRDFMRIAQTVAARGHHVRVYAQSWEGECPDVFELIKVPVKSHTNHGRNAEYFAWVQKHLREHPVDRVVGFNKMPGLDVYYAADVCYAEKVAQEKGFFYRLTSRYRHYAAFERATFEQGKPTQLLMLTDKQIADFQKHYQTEAERFHILPPGIYPDRKYSQQPANSREIFRKKNGITEQQYLLLQVGSDFTRKVSIVPLKHLLRYRIRCATTHCYMLLGRINRENLRRWQKNAACAVMFTSSRGATMSRN